MQRIIALIMVILIATCLFACAGERYLPPTYDESGNYLGFSDITESYTPEDAAEDGCLVIDSMGDDYTTSGYEKWKRFVERAEAGENAFLRVAHFIEGVGYYSDLHYYDGKYILFETNPELGTNKICEFKYLRCLEGNIGMPGEQKKHFYYVLTDSLELTYADVSRTIFASSAAMASDIPFKWLGFTTHFRDEILKQEG